LFAQQVGVALTGFGKIDDLVGDGLFDEIIGAFGPQRDAGISKATPRTRFSGSGRSRLRNGVIGIGALPVTGGSAIGLSATDAWLRAAVDDVEQHSGSKRVLEPNWGLAGREAIYPSWGPS
jgi:hypothetical protein